MSRILLLIIFVGLNILCFADSAVVPENNEIIMLKAKVGDLEKSLIELKSFDERAFNTVSSLAQTADSNIANKISILSMVLSFIGIGLTFGSVALVYYVNKVKKGVLKLRNQTQSLKNEITDFVASNNDLLYQKIIDKDTELLIERVANNHNDVSNIVNLLSVRSVKGEKNFNSLLDAYKNAFKYGVTEQSNVNSMISLSSLIYQHYAVKLLGEIDLFSHDNSLFCTRQIGFYSDEVVNVLNVLKHSLSQEDGNLVFKIILLGLLCNFRVQKMFNNSLPDKQKIVEVLKACFTNNLIFKKSLQDYIQSIDDMILSGINEIFYEQSGQVVPMQHNHLKIYLKKVHGSIYG